MDIGCYREFATYRFAVAWTEHKNARTRKGRRKTVANKKKQLRVN